MQDRMRKGRSVKIAILILFVLLWSSFNGACAGGEYASVSGPCNLTFPLDHASHPDYRLEWWYYTGNLVAEDGERYGFQLTFFRVRTVPVGVEKSRPKRSSAWRTVQVIAAHAALADISGKVFHHAEKMSRAAMNLAGAREQNDGFEVFVNGWKATIASHAHKLSAAAKEFSYTLDLVPRKEPVPHGDAGYSRKGEGQGEASCYYSVTRLDVSGKIFVGGHEKKVSGSAWMDHEFSSAPLNPHLAGWDWFGLQLSDGSDLMVYMMREKDGNLSPVSSGTYVGADGKALHIGAGDFRVQALSSWKSPHSGAVYPASWLLEIVPLDLRLKIVPKMTDQELQTTESTRVTYWEGSVGVEGTGKKDLRLYGEGYVELTGYAGGVGF